MNFIKKIDNRFLCIARGDNELKGWISGLVYICWRQWFIILILCLFSWYCGKPYQSPSLIEDRKMGSPVKI